MEIGSEFWVERDYICDPLEQFYSSGRSALNAIILDVKQRYGIEQVLLPSYCCDSMIIPFVMNLIRVRFYDVKLNIDRKISVEIPNAEKNEALFLMHYFGARIDDLRICGNPSDWAAVIVDGTHSFFSDFLCGLEQEYYFVSFRKWFAVTGIAMAKSRTDKLLFPDESHTEYVRLRNEAFENKLRFIKGESSDKKVFLDKFGQAELLLEKDCNCYTPDVKDYFRLQNNILHKDDIVSTRRANARALISGLCDIEHLSVIVNFDLDTDCPLFVPVVETTGRRNELRKHLIDNKIYCPVHWPVSYYHKGMNDDVQEIYNNELSLVCDQRYTVDDMNRIIECINKFYIEN